MFYLTQETARENQCGCVVVLVDENMLFVELTYETVSLCDVSIVRNVILLQSDCLKVNLVLIWCFIVIRSRLLSAIWNLLYLNGCLNLSKNRSVTTVVFCNITTSTDIDIMVLIGSITPRVTLEVIAFRVARYAIGQKWD